MALVKCDRCDGKGKIEEYDKYFILSSSYHNQKVTYIVCPKCDGKKYLDKVIQYKKIKDGDVQSDKISRIEELIRQYSLDISNISIKDTIGIKRIKEELYNNLNIQEYGLGKISLFTTSMLEILTNVSRDISSGNNHFYNNGLKQYVLLYDDNSYYKGGDGVVAYVTTEIKEAIFFKDIEDARKTVDSSPCMLSIKEISSGLIVE